MTQEHVPLSRYTTFGLGGPARRFSEVRSAQELGQILRGSSGDRRYLLGSGSNVLVNDTPLQGTVIVNRIPGIAAREHPDGVMLRIGAGVNWDELVEHTVANGWQGIECLSGIPGTVGAAPVQNIGAYGQSIADTLHSVRALDMDSGEKLELTREQCGFDYRKSIFQEQPLIITEVSLLLNPSGTPTLAYQDLQARFDGMAPTLTQVRDAVLQIRGSKGALAMDGWPRLRSAGSFFKNPVVSTDTFEAIKEELEHGDMAGRWFWPSPDGSVKISGGRLIEAVGFTRGYRQGAVGNSPYHSLTLVAYDGATAADIVGLARRIQESVAERFNIVLDVEPRLWGWDENPLLRSESVEGLRPDTPKNTVGI